MEKIENEITAAEARRIAETGIGEALRKELSRIFGRIQDASKANMLSVQVGPAISEPAKGCLIKNGFKVTYESGSPDPREPMPSYYLISW